MASNRRAACCAAATALGRGPPSGAHPWGREEPLFIAERRLWASRRPFGPEERWGMPRGKTVWVG